jgi:hypothetical protein
MRKAFLNLTQTAALFALVNTGVADQLVGNLDQVSSFSSGSPSSVNKYLQRFTSGPDWVQLQSVTIQQWGYSPDNPSAVVIELYRSDDSSPLGAFLNFAPISTPTDDPEQATFIDYSTDEPIDLAPNTEYKLVLSEPASTFTVADLGFTESDNFTAVSGWELGLTSQEWFFIVRIS